MGGRLRGWRCARVLGPCSWRALGCAAPSVPLASPVIPPLPTLVFLPLTTTSLLSLCLVLSYSACNWTRAAFIFPRLAYFTWRSALRVRLCCCQWESE